MPKIVKLLAWFLGLLVALLVSAAAAVVLFFNPNDYKGQIAGLVKEKTGRELTLEGNIQLSVFPWLGVTLGRMALSNAPGFGPEPFARVDSAAVKVQLLPLLRRKVVMDTITLRGLSLDLEIGRSGRANWQDLAGKKGGAEKAEGAGTTELGRGLAAFSVAGVDVRDAHIRWRDHRDDTSVLLDGVDVRSTPLVAGHPFEFQLNGRLKSSRPAAEGTFSIASRVMISPDAGRYRLDDFKLQTQLQSPTLPGKGLDMLLAADVAADTQRQTVDLAHLQVGLWNLTASGNLQAKQVLTTPHVTGTLVLAPFDPRKTLDALRVPAPPTANPAVLRQASAKLTVDATPSSVSLAPLTVRLDDTSLQGTVQVRDLVHPAVTFDAEVDGIDVDRYLPPRTEGRSDGASSARSRPAPVAGAAALLPVGLLRSLNLQGQLRVGRLKVSNLQLQDVRLQLDGRGGQLRLHPADAKLYQGRYQGDIRVDARGAEPRVALDESLSGIQLEPLLKSLQGRDWLSGSGGIQAKFTASGNTEQAMRRTLDGNLAFSFHDGAVKGINIAELIRRAKARIDGKALPPSTAPNQTDFAELSGTLQFEGGHARNHDLVLKSPLLRIAGAGEADLVGETVDYELKASIVATLEGQSGKGLEDLKGLTIPVKVQGSLLKPGFSLDLQALLGERAKAKIDQEKGKLEKKLEEKLKQKLPGLSDQLPRLFGP